MIDLTKGVRFEDNNTLLQWGVPIEDLSGVAGFKEINKSDRTIYEWGSHKILNGLELDLLSEYWNFGEELNNRKFLSIQYLAVGDNEAKESFDKISKHLLKEIGQATIMDESRLPDRIWKWKIKGADIHLDFLNNTYISYA